MRVQANIQSIQDLDVSWLAVGVFEGKVDPVATPLSTPLGTLLHRLIETKEINGSLAELVPLYNTGLKAEGVLAFGLGSAEKFDAGAAYSAGVAVGKKLSGKSRESVAVVLPSTAEPLVIASALIQGVVVGTKSAGLRKTEPARQPFGLLSLIAPPDLALESEALQSGARRGQIIGEAINQARDLVNTPPSEKPPSVLAEQIRSLAEPTGIVEVWDEARIKSERFGGLLGVAAGSSQPPAFVVLRYQGGGNGPPLALVGKGITFDSGGLSLKPSASMETMKSDMTGAAVVASTMQAIARLKLAVNVTGYLALAENMTGGSAMKLGDVLTMRNGTTVEVLNTDAEGRLILADALSYAVEQHPAAVIDLATLTGACMVALGQKIAGLFSNDEALSESVVRASRQAGERLWRMPLDEDFDEALKSTVADCKNVGGKWGGAVTAAKFLQKFVGQTPWAHLDIAGPSWVENESATQDVGGTGCFTRTLIALAESRSAST